MFLEPLWWLFVGWRPIYLADVYGFNVKEIGFFAWVPYVGAGIGAVAGLEGTVGIFAVIIMNFLVPVVVKVSYI